MRTRYRDRDRTYEVEVTHRGDERYLVTVDGAVLEIELTERGDAIDLRTPSGMIRAWVSRDRDHRFVTAPGVGEVVLEQVTATPRPGRRGPGDLSSPMPGKVVKVLVATGDTVVKGQPLVVVEAMKTELTVVAPHDGRVGRVDAQPDGLCEAGKPLLEVHPSEGSS